MKIDLHIHSKEGSDGKLDLNRIFRHIREKNLGLVSITDHDSIESQQPALSLAEKYGVLYLTGVELNITFSHPGYRKGKSTSLDLLGYQYDVQDAALAQKLVQVREFRRSRAQKILENINRELEKENRSPFTQKDLQAIEESVDGAFGRPHIADYLVRQGIVSSRQEAFDRYLIKCNVPKMPLSLPEASDLIRNAGGRVILAHPNDPNGTSLGPLASSLDEQHRLINESMRPFLDGIECWHSRHDQKTAAAYAAFAKREGLLMTGGSDCHQQPVILGTVEIPDFVARQFGY